MPFRVFRLLVLLTFAGSAPLPSHVQAAPVMQTLPVAPSYLGFVGSDNADTLDTAAPSSTREKLGSPMSIMTAGDKRAREIKAGYLTMFATWAQTTLRVPLGWYAVESNKNVDESLVYSPGQSVQIVARAAMEHHPYQLDPGSFGALKNRAAEQTRARLKEQNLSAGTIELTELADDAFIVRAPDVTDKAGHSFSYIEHFSHRATSAERAEYMAKIAANEPLSPLPMPLAMSLLTPADKFEKYLPLFGLMVHDAGLNWSHQDSYAPAEFAARVPDAAQFNKVADEAVALLKAGDAAAFRARFPEAFEGNEDAQIEGHLKQTVMPFFQRMPAKEMRTHYSVTSDRDPVEPKLEVSLVRDFELGPQNFPSYVLLMERVKGKIQLTAVGTTDDAGGV